MRNIKNKSNIDKRHAYKGKTLNHIEFMGLPGSGKSTIRNSLVETLKDTATMKYLTSDEAFLLASKENSDLHIRIILKTLSPNNAVKFIDKFMNRSQMQFFSQNMFLAKHGKSLNEFLLSDTYNSMSIDDKANVIGSFLETGSVYESISKQSKSGTMIFFEEGLIQKSFMFLSHHNREIQNFTTVVNYLSNIPLPDSVIYVKVDIKECFKRMKGRPSGLTDRLRDQDDSSIFRFLECATSHLDNIAEYLRLNSPVKVIEVNNVHNITDSVNELALLFSSE